MLPLHLQDPKTSFISRMSRYQSYKDGCNRDFRYESDYRPTMNTNTYYNPGQKRQFQRVHHEHTSGASNSRWPRDISNLSHSRDRNNTRK